jgi:hypothetical protein
LVGGLGRGDWSGGLGQGGQKKARLRKARRLLIVPFKTKLLLYNVVGKILPVDCW